MQDNFNIHSWKLKRAITELDEKTCPDCGCKMEGTMCNECGYMEEGATFTDKHDDNPKLKGDQKDLPDELQAKIVSKEGEDHEVSMAQNSLKSIISSASQLMSKLGNNERNIPGWIQDHITNAENFIDQANQGFHELEPAVKDVDTDVVTETVDNSTLKKVESVLDLVSNLKSNTSTNSNIPTTDKQGLVYAFQEIEDLLEDVAADIEQEGFQEINENQETPIQTELVAKDTAKAIVLALKEEGAKVTSLKLKNLDERSFDIYVAYNNGTDDEFSFHINPENELTLSDFTFTEVLGKVSEGGSIDVNEVKTNLLKTWEKHINK